MGDLRLYFAMRWRRWCDRRASLSVLVLGDSHVRVFSHWWFMWALPSVRWEVVYVPGGTASGLYNPRSQTQAYAQFSVALNAARHDYVLLNLGEVDTGYTIWARAQRDGASVQGMLAQAVKNYARLIQELASSHRLMVISAPLPTLADDPENASPGVNEVLSTRKKIKVSLPERTALTLMFNNQISAVCQGLGVPYFDDRHQSLGQDGCVNPLWCRQQVLDHHYDRKTYARWLCQQLKPVFRA